MAVFANLHDVGQTLAGYLRRNLTPALTDVIAAPPLETATGSAEAIRVSLMWVTPQPTHRNDPWVSGTDGQQQPPPVSLSGFYLVTAYGTTDAGEPAQAINRLGQAIQIFETGPVLQLPLADDPGTPENDPTPGTGEMSVVFVPTAADLMEKIYTPLQMRHRPWALFEVGPIQLARLQSPRPAPDVVQPGGVRLGDVRPIAPPRILRIAPGRVRAGGLVMLQTAEAGTAQGLRIGETGFTFADTPTGPFEIARPDAQGRIWVRYPAGASAGDVDAVLQAAQSGSDPAPIAIDPAGQPGLDAPLLAYGLGGELSLMGAALTQTDRVFLWPDRGIRAPDEVVELAPSSVTATTVTLNAAALSGTNLRALTYRVSLRMSNGQFTPFVVLEVTG